MAKPLSDAEREQIIDLLHAGESRNDIAARVGRSPGTITNIAREIGHRFGQTNLARAHEARRAYGAEARAATAARLHQEADLLLEQLHRPHLVFNIGGKDNVYTEHELSEPDVGAKLNLIRAAREALRTVLEIDKHDNRGDEVGSDFDRWLEEMGA